MALAVKYREIYSLSWLGVNHLTFTKWREKRALAKIHGAERAVSKAWPWEGVCVCVSDSVSVCTSVRGIDIWECAIFCYGKEENEKNRNKQTINQSCYFSRSTWSFYLGGPIPQTNELHVVSLRSVKTFSIHTFYSTPPRPINMMQPSSEMLPLMYHEQPYICTINHSPFHLPACYHG